MGKILVGFTYILWYLCLTCIYGPFDWVSERPRSAIDLQATFSFDQITMCVPVFQHRQQYKNLYIVYKITYIHIESAPNNPLWYVALV